MQVFKLTKNIEITNSVAFEVEHVTKKSNKDKGDIYLDVDEILSEIGQIGRLQVFIVFLFSTILIVPAYQALGMVFIATNPPWRCSKLVNNTECNNTVIYDFGDPGYESRCSMGRLSWEYTVEDYSSIISEFDLICANDPWSYAANSGMFIGQTVGAVCIGWMSDRFGRKTVILPSLFFLMTCSLVLSFAPNIITFIILRIISGLFYGGIFVCSIVMAVEVMGIKYRALGGVLMWQLWTVTTCFLSLQSNYIKNWRTLLLVVTVPYYILLPFGVRYMPESIRWQRSRNKLTEAENTLKRVAASNNKVYPDCKLSPVIEVSSGSYKDLFSNLKLMSMTLKFSIMWFCNRFIYFGISLAVSNLGGDLHRDFVLINLWEVPASIFSLFLLGKIGRKKSALLGYFVTATSMFTIALLQAYNIKDLMPIHILERTNSSLSNETFFFMFIEVGILVVLGMIGKVFSIISWFTCSIWSPESYPTSLRSKAIGFFAVFSQFGAALSPWISQWIRKFYLPLPFIVFGVTQVVGILTTFDLPETKNKSIRDVVDTIVTENVNASKEVHKNNALNDY